MTTIHLCNGIDSDLKHFWWLKMTPKHLSVKTSALGIPLCNNTDKIDGNIYKVQLNNTLSYQPNTVFQSHHDDHRRAGFEQPAKKVICDIPHGYLKAIMKPVTLPVWT